MQEKQTTKKRLPSKLTVAKAMTKLVNDLKVLGYEVDEEKGELVTLRNLLKEDLFKEM